MSDGIKPCRRVCIEKYVQKDVPCGHLFFCSEFHDAMSVRRQRMELTLRVSWHMKLGSSEFSTRIASIFYSKPEKKEENFIWEK